MSDTDDATQSLEPPIVPPALETPRAKLSYLYLRVTGGARVGELSDALGLSLLSLYPTVARLVDAGVVERTDEGVLRARRTPLPST